MITRQHFRLTDVVLVRTQKIECAPRLAETPIDIEMDGELAGRLPAMFEIVPDALTILVPNKR